MSEVLPKRHYRAFISYRHADNREEGRKWAEWLHQNLEQYEVPPDLAGRLNERGKPVPDSLYPVFRDEEELPADADLSESIRRALEASEVLIVLCSPRAVESVFVRAEIRIWKELGRGDRLLAVMIDGEPNADDPTKQAFGVRAQECLPYELRWGVPRRDGSIDWSMRTEPICADLRPGGRPEQGFTSAAALAAHLERDAGMAKAEVRRARKEYAARLELAMLKVVAGTLQLPLGPLRERDARYRAARLRRLATVLGVAAVLAVGGAVTAYMQKRSADAARAAQLGQLKEASRSDHATAEDQLFGRQWREGLAYLARATQYDPDNVDAQIYLWTSIAWQTSGPARLPDEAVPVAAGVHLAALDPTGKTVLLRTTVDSHELTRIADGQRLGPTLGSTKAKAFGFSADGGSLGLADDTGRITVLDTATGTVRFSAMGSREPIAFGLAPDGRRAAVASGSTLRLIDVDSGKWREIPVSSETRELLFSPDGGSLVLRRFEATPFILQLEPAGAPLVEMKEIEASACGFDPQTGRLFVFSLRGQAAIYERGKSTATCLVNLGRQWDGPAKIDAGGKVRVMCLTEGTAELCDVTPPTPDGLFHDGQEVKIVRTLHVAEGFRWDAELRWFLEREPGGAWDLWQRDADGSEERWSQTDPEDWSDCALDRAGHVLIEVTHDGLLAVYRLRPGPPTFTSGWPGGPKALDLPKPDKTLVLRNSPSDEPRLFNPLSNRWISPPLQLELTTAPPIWTADGAALQAPLASGATIRWPVPRPKRAPSQVVKLVSAVCGRSLPPGEAMRHEPLGERLRTRARWLEDKVWDDSKQVSDPDWKKLMRWWLAAPANRQPMLP